MSEEEQLIATLERNKELIAQIMSRIAEQKAQLSDPLSSHQDAWYRLLLKRMELKGETWCSQCGHIVLTVETKLQAIIDVSSEKNVSIHRKCYGCRRREQTSTTKPCFPAVANSDGTFSYGFSLDDTENLTQVGSESGHPISLKSFREITRRFHRQGNWFFKQLIEKFEMPPRIRIDMQTATYSEME